MRSREVEIFENQLKKLFDQIDHELEDRWAGTYPLHPARPSRNTTRNPELDGLFNIGASFSAGYGSTYGKGYVVEIRLVTLQTIEEHIWDEIRRYTRRRISELLPRYFPDRELSVHQDGNLFKITGDLSL